jgi:hypothetical protein
MVVWQLPCQSRSLPGSSCRQTPGVERRRGFCLSGCRQAWLSMGDGPGEQQASALWCCGRAALAGQVTMGALQQRNKSRWQARLVADSGQPDRNPASPRYAGAQHTAAAPARSASWRRQARMPEENDCLRRNQPFSRAEHKQLRATWHSRQPSSGTNCCDRNRPCGARTMPARWLDKIVAIT